MSRTAETDKEQVQTARSVHSRPVIKFNEAKPLIQNARRTSLPWTQGMTGVADGRGESGASLPR